ncbi:MAG: hypothetical protein ACLP2H_02745 [Terriglobales bacterium]
MAKYGLFHPTGKRPLHTYEGDLMQRDGEFVNIMKHVPNDPGNATLVGAIRLDKGFSVREITGESFEENKPERAQVGGHKPGPWS